MNNTKNTKSTKKALQRRSVVTRASSYKKLKEEIRELRNDIYEIIMKDNVMVKKQWQLRFKVEEVLWMGNENPEEGINAGIKI